MRPYRELLQAPRRALEAISREGSEVSPGTRRPATDRRSLGWLLGDWYEMVRKGRTDPLWPPVGPDRRGDTQEVTKKPASRAARV